MPVVKKDFKNIYESGIKELTEIELQAIQKAQNKKTEHSNEQKETSQKSLEDLGKKSELLRVELKQSINDSLKKLQDTLALENAQNEAFLISIMTELTTLTGQMKVRLNALKHAHAENVDFAKTVAAEHYLTNSEEMNFTLEHNLSNSIQNINGKAKANFQSLQSSFEQTLIKLQNHTNELTKSNLTALKDESYSIADHSSSLLKKFFVDSQAKLSQLETSARQASSEVDSSSDSLKKRISEHAGFTETQINKTYEEISTAHFQNADNRLSEFADELSTLHEATTEELITKTDELADDLLQRSKHVQDSLRSRCGDVVNRVDNLFSAFQSKLNDRLQFSQGQKQALESDKNRILTAVQSELVSIQKEFGKKIAGMLDQSKAELLDLTKSAETRMLTTTESLSEKMCVSANSIQQQIENEVTKFLQEITLVRSAALEEISGAAKGNVSFSKDTDLNSDIEDSEVRESDQNDFLLMGETRSSEIIDNEELNLGENKTKRSRRRKDNQE